MPGSSGALTGFTVALSHPQGIAIGSVGNCSTKALSRYFAHNFYFSSGKTAVEAASRAACDR